MRPRVRPAMSPAKATSPTITNTYNQNSLLQHAKFPISLCLSLSLFVTVCFVSQLEEDLQPCRFVSHFFVLCVSLFHSFQFIWLDYPKIGQIDRQLFVSILSLRVKRYNTEFNIYTLFFCVANHKPTRRVFWTHWSHRNCFGLNINISRQMGISLESWILCLVYGGPQNGLDITAN